MEQSTLSKKRPRSPESRSSVKHDQGAAAAAAASTAAVGEDECDHNKQFNSTKRTVASLSDLDSSDSEGDTPVATSSITSTRASSTQPIEPNSATEQPAATAAASKAQSAPTATAAAAAAAPAFTNEYDAIDDELLAAALPCDTLVAIQSLQRSCYVTAAAAQQANKKAQRKAPQSTPAEISGRLVLQHQIYTVFENRTAGNDM
jgi:hypothetical protein